jgi:DNA polymerase (family 10)
MLLKPAQEIANQIIEELKPYCDRIEVAGSIRRKKSIVGDIDIVLIPSNQGQVLFQLAQFGKLKLSGPKIIRVTMGFTKGIDLDCYIATPETWATILLIRTGSKEHNIRMCMRAANMGMKLHADGSGLFRKVETEMEPGVMEREERIAGDTEESIFEALGLPYKRPEEREWE